MSADARPLIRMEARGERLTVRLTSTERQEWDDAARRAGEETSRFFRRCASIGRKVREAGVLAEAAGA